MQFNKDDNKATSDFLALLINLGATPKEAYERVNEILTKYGWSFVYFNDYEDFWIIENEIK